MEEGLLCWAEVLASVHPASSSWPAAGRVAALPAVVVVTAVAVVWPIEEVDYLDSKKYQLLCIYDLSFHKHLKNIFEKPSCI